MSITAVYILRFQPDLLIFTCFYKILDSGKVTNSDGRISRNNY